MELKIDICTELSCKVTISDKTEIGGDGYLPEESAALAKDKFKYSETLSIDVLQHNKSKTPVLQTPVFTKHEDITKPVTIPVSFDGWFTVLHIVLPTKEWFDRESSKETGSLINLYDTIYYSDGFSIFKYHNGIKSEATVTEVVERNPDNTTIYKVCENYVSICFLNRCYISLCQKILNDRAFTECYNKNDIDPDLIFRRDYVWMALNVIRYLVQFEQLAEAERIISKLGGCNGLCKDEFKSMPSNRCGCCK